MTADDPVQVVDTAHRPPAAQYPQPPGQCPSVPSSRSPQPLAPDPLAAATGAGVSGSTHTQT